MHPPFLLIFILLIDRPDLYTNFDLYYIRKKIITYKELRRDS